MTYTLVSPEVADQVQYELPGKQGETYCLYAISRDNVNNREAAKTVADTCFVFDRTVTGISDKANGDVVFIVYPNPNEGDKFNFILKGTEVKETVRIELVDMLGRVLAKKSYNGVNKLLKDEVTMSPQLEPGMYFVHCYTTESKLVKKILVQK